MSEEKFELVFTERDRRELNFELFLQFAMNNFKYSHSTMSVELLQPDEKNRIESNKRNVHRTYPILLHQRYKMSLIDTNSSRMMIVVKSLPRDHKTLKKRI